MQAVASLCNRAILLRPGTAPLLADVASVTGAYMTPEVKSADPRVTVTELRLSEDGAETKLTEPVRPMARLRLSVSIRAEQMLPRCGMALLVTRSDGLTIFDGSSLAEGVPGVTLEAGTDWRCVIRFKANVLKGTYMVGVVLLDALSRWPAVRLVGLASFVVLETTRWAGCSELEPKFELSGPPRFVPLRCRPLHVTSPSSYEEQCRRPLLPGGDLHHRHADVRSPSDGPGRRDLASGRWIHRGFRRLRLHLR